MACQLRHERRALRGLLPSAHRVHTAALVITARWPRGIVRARAGRRARRGLESGRARSDCWDKAGTRLGQGVPTKFGSACVAQCGCRAGRLRCCCHVCHVPCERGERGHRWGLLVGYLVLVDSTVYCVTKAGVTFPPPLLPWHGTVSRRALARQRCDKRWRVGSWGGRACQPSWPGGRCKLCFWPKYERALRSTGM